MSKPAQRLAGVILTTFTLFAIAGDVTTKPPMVSAEAWAVSRLAPGEILYSRNIDVALPIASLTKVMTALIVLEIAGEEEGFLDRFVPVSAKAASTIGTSALLETGDRLRVSDLLYGLLLPSGNDAAVALAEQGGRYLRDHPGDSNEARFLHAMNARAAALGMSATRFEDVHGMGENVSSPADLLVLSSTALENTLFREMVLALEYPVRIRTNRGSWREILWRNTNELLPDFRGVKTGHTNMAGGCLVLLGEHRGEEYLVVVLDSANKQTRFSDAHNLFQWAMLQQELGVPAPE